MSTLYRRLLGQDFERLPPAVRALHDVREATTWVGRADVVRGSTSAARLVATLFGLPPAGADQPLRVTFTPDDATEQWVRVFGDKRFVSTQSAVGAVLHERVGPCVLHMTLQQEADGLGLTLQSARLLGVPLPKFLLPQISTRESDRDGRYHFDVAAHVPLFGLLVHYVGWLEREAR
jgi:Domain of unknown function (DUF4166)